MLGNFTVWLTNHALKRSNLTVEQRNSIIVHIMGAVDALPLQDIIETDEEGHMVVNGKVLDVESIMKLRESANAALDNTALKVVKQQVAFAAIALGVHTVESERQMIFARAALWYHQQVEKHLKILAQRE